MRHEELLEDGPAPNGDSLAARWVPVEAAKQRFGGQGVVTKVRDRQSPKGPDYALKELRYEKSRTSAGYRRFVREIRTLRDLDHPNIVKLADAYVPETDDGTTPFYVMPWAERSLKHARYLRGNVQAVLQVGVQLADALAAAADRGIVHRDVKPENVLLLGEEDTPALCDFGICHLRDETERLTDTHGKTVGSRGFAAPELEGGRLDDVDSRADVYSLGKTLYVALSGGPEFPREEYDDPRYDLRQGNTLPLEHFYGVLERMVARDREQRFPSIGACRDALRRALENVTRGERYIPGMYGRVAAPSEIAARLTTEIARLSADQRRDVVRLAIDEALDEIESVIQRESVTAEGMPVRLPLDKQREIAAALTERALAVILPLVAAGEIGGFERIVASLRDALEREVRLASERAQFNIRAAVGTAVLYAAAAVAWRLERWPHLRAICDVYVTSAHSFVYLEIADGHSTNSWNWVVEALKTSQVLPAVDERLARDLQRWLDETTGLLMLAYALNLPAKVRAKAFEVGLPPVDFSPLYSTDWLESFPRRVREDAPRERELSTGVFGLGVDVLRPEVAKLTPSLKRALAERRRRDTFFLFTPESQWSKWCGFKGRDE